MDLFAEWMAAKNGMLNTLIAMIDADQLAHADPRDELLSAIDHILSAGAETGDIRTDTSAEDVAAGLIGILTVTGPPPSTHRPPASSTPCTTASPPAQAPLPSVSAGKGHRLP